MAAWAEQLRASLLTAEDAHAALLAGRTLAATQLGGVSEQDRATVVEWLLQLSFDCNELRCSRATLGVAVLWLDTMLAIKPWPRPHLQLLSGGLYWVATKHEEYHYVEATDMVTLAMNGGCSVGELHAVEAIMLDALRYRLPSACAAQWAEEALRVAGLWPQLPGVELPPALQTVRHVMDVRGATGRRRPRRPACAHEPTHTHPHPSPPSDCPLPDAQLWLDAALYAAPAARLKPSLVAAAAIYLTRRVVHQQQQSLGSSFSAALPLPPAAEPWVR